MHVISDLQIHSRFSRAVSKSMTLSVISEWAKKKGIGLVATGDWTHPMWLREIERDLSEIGSGFLCLKSTEKKKIQDEPQFLLATEISCIYKQGGRVRRVHTLIWVPTLESARKIGQEMTKRGCNLMSDGRPIIGLTSIQVAELVFSVDSKALVIPAHAWTPWFSVYGSLGGFDSIEEAFGKYADRIYAVETGLSSNPMMNWRIPELDTRTILSFSDAHSAPKLGREATVFDMEEMSYDALYQAVRKQQIVYTIEFYPEEGKYHYTGHRSCKVRQTPQETRKNGTSCPVCGKKLTVGVMHRVDELAGRTEDDLQITEIEPVDPTIKMNMIASRAFPARPPFVMLVPLAEIIAESFGQGVQTKKVQMTYARLVHEVAPEFDILLRTEPRAIARIAGDAIAEGVVRIRRGQVHIDPGYDGVFGVVKIWEDDQAGIAESGKEQLTLL